MSFSLRNEKKRVSVAEIMGKWYCVGSSGIKKPNTEWPWHDFRSDTVFPFLEVWKAVTGKERLWRTSVFHVKLPLNSQILFFDVLKGERRGFVQSFLAGVFWTRSNTNSRKKHSRKKYVVVTSDAKEKNPKMHQTLPLPEFRYSYPIPPPLHPCFVLFFLSWQ